MSVNNKKTKNIPAFLQKTYNMLQDSKNECAVEWAPNGVGFIILNQEILTKSVLPKYFKHSNYSSFIRQLNMYDFHKIRKGNIQNYFHHDKFIRNDLDLISQIKRKPEKKKNKEFSDQQNNLRKHPNKTQITLNSTQTIKPKSEQSIMRESTDKNYGIFYEELDCKSDENRFSHIEINNDYSIQNEEDNHHQQSSSKMSINNQIIQSGFVDQQQQKEILIPSHGNIFHFINPYQLANFGIFM